MTESTRVPSSAHPPLPPTTSRGTGSSSIRILDKLWSYFFNLAVSEFQVLCCKEPLSQFRHMPVKEIDQFQWEPLMTELQCKAPLLLKLLSAVVVREDRRWQVKNPAVHYPAIVTATAILLKERNREMSGVQSIVSCLMYACHSEKQVLYMVVTYFPD